MLKLKPHQAGETILEVLISLSVLALVLGVSYALAGRSLRTSQNAQEQTIASQLAQSMIEVIKTYAVEAEVLADAGDSAMADAIFPAGTTTFCLSTNLSDVAAVTVPVAPPNPICDKDIYRTKVEARHIAGSNPQAYEYVATVEWDSLVSGNVNQVAMRYRWTRVPIL